ncbi:MAG TPA: hypothetical protein VF095_10830 [Bacillota bacterium]
MNKWFYFNALLLILAMWNLINHHSFPNLPVHIIIGFIGLLFILFNWTRHAVFSTIRSHRDRQTKIKYANLSKKVIPFHRWTGTTAFIVIFIHAGLVVQLYGWQWDHFKMVSGLLAIILLTTMVITGWLRLYWPSVPKRMAHLYGGLFMFFAMIAHFLL